MQRGVLDSFRPGYTLARRTFLLLSGSASQLRLQRLWCLANRLPSRVLRIVGWL